MKTIIKSVESYLPEKVLTNEDLSKFLDTSHDWIYSRTGIEKRHLVDKDELTSDLGLKAAIKAIESAQISPSDLDAIVVATATSDRRFPSAANKIQGDLGANRAFAFDLNAACSGFIYALFVCDSFIKSHGLKNILLIAADTLSLFIDWTDRATCVLFGDGAGAVVLQATEDNVDRGIVAAKLYSDGTKYDYILANNGPQNDHRGYTTMLGSAVFKYAIEYMALSISEILSENNMTIDDIDWIIPHQANKRIIDSLCKLKNFPIEKVIISIKDQANTSAASIPLAMDYAIKNSKLKRGDTILLVALGAGLAWGAAIIKF
ncbi:MAG: ketoacyl-ACP synthase III [Holosporales bacterium]|jgi:3-oxoacyl-[acyl-carrier-protein] synthase-3|nr:ketoacyl-ACP synthase III [Holosporales bacterium]